MKAPHLILLTGIFALVGSCRKDPVSFTVPPPNITHIDPAPDYIVQSCDSFITWPGYYVPQPNGASFMYYFDLDASGDTDLVITATNFYEWHSNTTPQNNYQGTIHVASPDSSLEFAWQGGYPLLALQDTLDPIDMGLPHWCYQNYMVFFHTGMPFGQNIYNVKYVAFRRMITTGQYKYGWLRFKKFGSLPGYQYYLTDWGWNNTINQSIGAGEY